MNRVIALVLVATLAACPAGRKGKKLGEPCSVNNDCAAAHCTSGQVSEPTDKSVHPEWFCTQSCTSDADCATPDIKLVCDIKRDPQTNPENRGVCALAKP
jgi:hypothetical protein